MEFSSQPRSLSNIDSMAVSVYSPKYRVFAARPIKINRDHVPSLFLRQIHNLGGMSEIPKITFIIPKIPTVSVNMNRTECSAKVREKGK